MLKLKDYQWKNEQLKKKYQLYDYGALALVVVILLLAKFVEGSMLYIWITVAIIILLQWACYKIKKQDKESKDE